MTHLIDTELDAWIQDTVKIVQCVLLTDSLVIVLWELFTCHTDCDTQLWCKWQFTDSHLLTLIFKMIKQIIINQSDFVDHWLSSRFKSIDKCLEWLQKLDDILHLLSLFMTDLKHVHWLILSIHSCSQFRLTFNSLHQHIISWISLSLDILNHVNYFDKEHILHLFELLKLLKNTIDDNDKNMNL